MKQKICLLLLLTFALNGCYEVPDNFPKADFYSYVPYYYNEGVRFICEEDTVIYVVTNTWEEYYRGKTTCKCGKENAYRGVTLTNLYQERGEPVLDFSILCADRAYFSIYLHSKSINASYKFGYLDEDIWAISYDETKIFKSFTDTLTLLQDDVPAAQVVKGKGITWLIDADGKKWTLFND